MADQLIVRYRTGVDRGRRQALRAELALDRVRELPLIGAEVVFLNGQDPGTVQRRLLADPAVEYAEPNYIISVDAVPDDPDFARQWGLHNTGQTGGTPDADMDAPEAWDVATGGPIIIGITDTGVDTGHVDLRANIWTNPGEIPGNGIDDDGNGFVDDLHGWNFLRNTADPMDDNGHGTHVAGIAAAVGNNGVGVAGVCWPAVIMPLKFIDANGTGPTSEAIRAIHYALAAGVRITCNSWGNTVFSQALKDAMDSAAAYGMLVVAAAGNERKNTDIYPHYPASYSNDGIVAVAATDARDRIADEVQWGTNWGPTTVDLAAPGVNIYSTFTGGYAYQSGTSMATPFVAGAAALLWSEHPELTSTQVKSRLMATVDPLPDLARKTVSGGRLNVHAAVADHDTTPPLGIGDLTVEAATGTRATLSWTATGDDGVSGQAQTYDIRYSTAPIDADNFAAATAATESILPQPAEATERITISGLDYGTTYYFAITAADDWFNASGLSNVVGATTIGPPVAHISIDSLLDSLLVGDAATHTFTLANLGPGEMFYAIHADFPFVHTEPPMAATAAAGLTRDILLIYADVAATGLAEILAAYPDVGRVDLWLAGEIGGSIPTYRDVAGYDVLVAWNNKSWDDRWAIGALLADFIDSGGAVVTLVDAWGAEAFASNGRYFDSAGYSPFASLGEALFDPRTLGWYNAAHPIMAGVQSLAVGSFTNQVSLTPGAVEVARWDDGTPLVATNPRTVALNVWPGDGYHWSGDFPSLIRNAINYAAGENFWLSLEPNAGEVAPFGDSVITAKLDTRNLDGGTYAAKIAISTSDPSLPYREIDVQLDVRGVPQLAVPGDPLEFGQMFLGYPRSLLLTVSNPGTDLLAVTDVGFDLPFFSSDVAAFDLAPGESTPIDVRFAPVATGEMWGTLRLTSNDPLAPVRRIVLHGFTEEPPEAVLTPGALGTSLFTGGAYSCALTLRNAGASDLQYEIYSRGAKPPSEAVPDRQFDLSARAAGTTDTIRVLAWTRFADHSPGAELDHMIAAISAHFTEFTLTETDETDPERLDSLLERQHVFLVPEQENAQPEITAIGMTLGRVLVDFTTRGGTVVFAQEWRHADGFISSTGLLDVKSAGRSSVRKLKAVAPDHPLLSAVTDALWGYSWTSWYELSTLDAEVVVIDSVSGQPVVISRDIGSGQVVLLGFDYQVYSSDMARLLANAMQLSRHTFDWLEATPGGGVISPGDSAQVQATLSAATLPGGEYNAEIVVVSNDPAAPRLFAFVDMSVTDAPDLDLSTQVLDFGSVFVETADTLWLRAANSGVLSLAVSELQIDNEAFTCDSVALALEPGESTSVPIVFAPQAGGPHSATLRMASNDPDGADQAVQLLGSGLNPPRISARADTAENSLHMGGRVARTLQIENRGGSDLRFQIATQLPPASPGAAAAEIAVDSGFSDWHSVTPPSVPRSQHCLVAHPDGRIFMFGGFGVGGSPVPTLEIYDPLSDTWSTGSPMPGTDRGMASAADVSGRIYAFTAIEANSFCYDPEVDTWSPICDPPVKFLWSAAATTGPDGRIYLVGGEDKGPLGPSDLVQIYDPETDSWILGEPMPTARYQHRVVTGQGGLIYAIGGRADFTGPSLATVEIYDAVKNQWTTGPDLQTPRNKFAAAVGIDGRIYVAGGQVNYDHREGPFLASVEIFDPHTAAWLAGPPLPEPRGELNAVSSGRAIYAIGGTDTAFAEDGWSLATPRWLAALPAEGVVPAQSELAVDLILDATGLAAGAHLARLWITSNDPFDPVVGDSLAISVSSAPDLFFPAEMLQFGAVLVGAERQVRLPLANLGDLPLDIQIASADPAIISLEPKQLVLPPGTDSAVHVFFHPTSAGVKTTTITLRSNDPDSDLLNVTAGGEGVSAPIITTSSDALAFDLFAGGDTAAVLRVGNSGPGTLTWRIEGLSTPETATSALSAIRGVSSAAPASELSVHLARLDGVRIAISDYYSSDSFERIRQDLGRRGASVHRIYRPITTEKMDSIDVLALDDYVVALSASELGMLRDWLMDGGSLLLQNRRVQAQTDSLLHGTGISQLGSSDREATLTKIHRHPATLGVDSVFAAVVAIFSMAEMPALPVVLDEFGRSQVVASHLGSGRILVTGFPLAPDDSFDRADTRLFANRVYDWLAYGAPLTVDPAEGEIAPGAQQEITVATASAALVAGEYGYSIALHSNDPLHPVMEVPVQISITGVPRIAVAVDTLDLGPSWVGYGTSRSLSITNVGSADLSVIGLELEGGAFAASPGSLAIPVFADADLDVTIVPDSAGRIWGRLVIRSDAVNAPETEVILRGEGLMPPEIEWSVDSLLSYIHAGESTRTSMTIANDGVSDLIYAVDVLPFNPLESPDSGAATPMETASHSDRAVLPASAHTPRPDVKGAQAAVPPVYEYEGDLMRFGVGGFGDILSFQYPKDTAQIWSSGYGFAYRSAGDDNYVWVYDGLGPLTPLQYEELVNDSFKVVVRFTALTEDELVRVTRQITFERQNRYVTVDTRLTNLNGWTLEDVVIKAFADWDIDITPRDDTWDYDRERNLVYGYDRRWAGLAARDKPDYMDIEARDDYWLRSTTISYPQGPIMGHDGMVIVHHEVGDLPPGGTVGRVTTLAIGDSLRDLQRQVDRGLQLVHWLSSRQVAGAISADSQAVLEFEIDAGALMAGHYRAGALISSNDPARPELWVPIVLHVEGAPEISLDTAELDFGTAYVGYPQTRPVVIRNRGTDTLRVSSVQSSHTQVTTAVSAPAIAPGDISTLWVTVAAVDTGLISAAITIQSNDSLHRSSTVMVSARGARPPTLAWGPDTLVFDVGIGGEQAYALTIHNEGPGPLYWSLPELAALSPRMSRNGSQPEAALDSVPIAHFVTAEPAAGEVPPGASQDATLVVTSAYLGAGDYASSLRLDHNDPARTEIILSVALHLFAVESGDTNADERINTMDIIYLVNMLWKEGPDPFGNSGDVNCDGSISIIDVNYLINYVFKGGPDPGC